MIRNLTVLVVSLAAAAGLAIDDLDNVVFEGVVRDANADLVGGASVTVLHVPTGVSKTLISDSSGRYRLVVSAPGEFSLHAVAPGFGPDERVGIVVESARRVSVDFVLVPLGVTEEVTVSGDAIPMIDSTRTTVGDTITGSEIQDLPNFDRDPLEFVFLLGGVAEAPLATAGLASEGSGVFLRGSPEEAGIFTLTGAPATSNNITIDGLDNNDDRAARERIVLPPETVEEVQIVTNQYAAEYGRASGGRINLRTRGGSNGIRGNAHASFADESLDANTFFRNARGLGRLPLQRRRAGIVTSGPIVRSRHFFLGAYERYQVPGVAEINALVPARVHPDFPLPLPNDNSTTQDSVGLYRAEVATPEYRNLVNARLDFSASDSRSVSVRIDSSRGRNLRGFPGGGRLFETALVQGRNSHSVSVSDSLALTSSVLNQARVQISRLSPRNGPASVSTGVIINEPQRIVAGSFTGGAAAPSFAREETRVQIQESLSISRGSTTMKAGFDFQRLRASFIDLFAIGGQYTFDGVDDFLEGKPSRYLQRFDTESRLGNDIAGIFLQSELQIAPGLRLTAGGRWDGESILADRDNFSPRLSIAWDPFAAAPSGSGGFRVAGRTVLRCGFGVFYNRALLRTLDDFSLGRSRLTIDSAITPAVLDHIRFPGKIEDRATVEKFGVSETGFLRRIGPDLEIPYTIQTGAGIQREMARGLLIGADYVFTRAAHLWRETNVNAPVLPAGFADFTAYLLSRDFDNRPRPDGRRPISGASADVVRFDLGSGTSSTSGAVRVLNGVRVLTLGLNTPRSANVAAALNAVRPLRPDPSLTQVEQLESTGNSFYHGGILSIRLSPRSGIGFRATYTLSKLIDEGTTNTASPQDLSDRRAERALSLQDQRHRFTFSGSFDVPIIGVRLSPVISFGSSRPFNIGSGVDRNLNDISNDRPDPVEPIGRPQWRKPGRAAPVGPNAFRLAPIGANGHLPRNYGKGPGSRTLNLRASRPVALGKLKVRPSIDVFNLFNSTVFSFGSEFINRDDSDFLTPRRTQRPRSITLNIRVDF